MKCVELICVVLATFVSDAVQLDVDFEKTIARMKPEHGVGQPPLMGIKTEMFHYLTEAGVPYSRLHDVGGWFGGNMFVDIPNVFRDFEADEDDPANYDFAFTDILIKGLIDSGVEPYYRLGVSIENFYQVKRYRTHPPKDYAKWARICEHVVRHYTEGWANGFRYKMTYWEIWVEPDVEGDDGALWAGTFEEYCRFYETAAKHLKWCFPHLKFGAYGASGLYALVQENPRPHDHYTKKCVDDFLAHVKRTSTPLDFFSIHAYDMDGAWLSPETMKTYVRYCREELDRIGYGKTEISMNEWLPRWTKPGSARQAAVCASLLIALQDTACDNAMIFDGSVGIGQYKPLFDPNTLMPRRAYWALCNFNELYRLGRQTAVSGMPENVYAIAAADGRGMGKVFVANIGKEVPIAVSVPGWRLITCQLTDEYRQNTVIAPPSALPEDSFVVYTFLKQ